MSQYSVCFRLCDNIVTYPHNTERIDETKCPEQCLKWILPEN